MYGPIVNYYQDRTNEDYVQVGGCNHTRSSQKWALSLEVLLIHPTTKFFEVSTYFSGSSLCQICAIWVFSKSQEVSDGADHLRYKCLITANVSIRKNGAQFSNMSGVEMGISPFTWPLPPTIHPLLFTKTGSCTCIHERLASVRA